MIPGERIAVETVHIVAVIHARAYRVITTHAGSTSLHGGTNPSAQAETTEQRVVAAVDATGPADSADRLPIYAVMAEHLPTVSVRSPHAMPHKAVQYLPQTLGKGELLQQYSLWVCYTAHTCLPLYTPSAEVSISSNYMDIYILLKKKVHI